MNLFEKKRFPVEIGPFREKAISGNSPTLQIFTIIVYFRISSFPEIGIIRGKRFFNEKEGISGIRKITGNFRIRVLFSNTGYAFFFPDIINNRMPNTGNHIRNIIISYSIDPILGHFSNLSMIWSTLFGTLVC